MSTKRSADGRLATTLFGQTRRRILALLFGKTDEEFYVREIARATDSPAGTVHRELQALAASGILERRRKGNQVLYRPARDCPIFPELRSLVMKTVGLVEVLRGGLSPLRDRTEIAFVFGSMAGGRSSSTSDVDLFVVGDVSFGEVVRLLGDAQKTIGREVNPVVQSIQEFRRRIRERDHFVVAVLGEPKLFVMGSADDLDRLGAERLADAAHDQ